MWDKVFVMLVILCDSSLKKCFTRTNSWLILSKHYKHKLYLSLLWQLAYFVPSIGHFKVEFANVAKLPFCTTNSRLTFVFSFSWLPGTRIYVQFSCSLEVFVWSVYVTQNVVFEFAQDLRNSLHCQVGS